VLEFLTGRTGRMIAQGAVLTAVVAGTAVYASVDKSVTLSVDGRTEKVHAFARTVDGLLDSQDIRVGDRDLVAPAPGAELGDGDKVVVRYARQLRLTADGEQRMYWTTELTVDEALPALGIRSQGARLSASRSQPIGRTGLAMSLFTPKQVSLTADGKRRALTTTAPTVAQLLAEQSLSLGSLDKLSIVGSSPVVDGLSVRITRIEKKRVTRSETVGYGTTERSSSTLYKGQTKVLEAGRVGSRSAVYVIVLADGKQTSKKLVSSTLTRKPVTKIVQAGTKSRPVARTPSSTGGADGLNWAALAQCESGGNPNIVNPAGPYYGLYQFSLSTWRSVGGSGTPVQNSSGEQTYRAKLLYNKAGAGQWPVCGSRLFS
jgi:uncharacterized protein YabE (DUF348 family)